MKFLSAIVIFLILIFLSLPSFSIEEEQFLIATADNWQIGLSRYHLPSYNKSIAPIIFIPGFIENRFTFNFTREQSMVRYLSQIGFDLWVMEYRGSGLSTPKNSIENNNWDFSVDDFVHYDLPASINFILKETNKKQLILIGHSMGGLIAYGYMETEHPEKVRAAITLAGVGFMGNNKEYGIHPTMFAIKYLSIVEPMVTYNLPLPMREVGKSSLKLPITSKIAAYLLSREIGYIFWQPLNMTDGLVEHAFNVLIDNISMNIVKQFAEWTRCNDVFTFGPNPYEKSIKNISSDFYKKNGFYSYTKNLNKIKAPILLAVGAADSVMPPQNVRYAYDRIGSSDKEFIIFGKEFGHAVDYGHEDICFGIHSPKEVYPKIGDWLIMHNN